MGCLCLDGKCSLRQRIFLHDLLSGVASRYTALVLAWLVAGRSLRHATCHVGCPARQVVD
ncbi:hypothetical protein ABZ379_47520 [Streptomyces canus]|uniref:hypothetical protein n=1 Tax=Streptomyces canus TaxID=58343 RepID=UPI0033E79BAF